MNIKHRINNIEKILGGGEKDILTITYVRQGRDEESPDSIIGMWKARGGRCIDDVEKGSPEWVAEEKSLGVRRRFRYEC